MMYILFLLYVCTLMLSFSVAFSFSPTNIRRKTIKSQFNVNTHNNCNKILTERPKSSSSFNKIVLFMGTALNESPMELCEESANQVIEELRAEMGTIFGYDPASQAVGITGKIELVELDGPTVVIALSGRFWHATDTVMLRVESFVRQRIPEVLEVILSREKSDIVDDNRLNTEPGGKKLF